MSDAMKPAFYHLTGDEPARELAALCKEAVLPLILSDDAHEVRLLRAVPGILEAFATLLGSPTSTQHTVTLGAHLDVYEPQTPFKMPGAMLADSFGPGSCGQMHCTFCSSGKWPLIGMSAERGVMPPDEYHLTPYDEVALNLYSGKVPGNYPAGSISCVHVGPDGANGRMWTAPELPRDHQRAAQQLPAASCGWAPAAPVASGLTIVVAHIDEMIRHISGKVAKAAA